MPLVDRLRLEQEIRDARDLGLEETARELELELEAAGGR
jgi:hypothetical protein